ncbi:VOC family protein [Mesorhizobium sp. L-8-10]|uniref:VOC family protein n=1 Tax=Mesorhizobium sp. L-8-10 TaxID=2744523 RepID=UPI0019283093|nr:VOC family protein [Mesorhizobium sp. L-8-10]
MEHNITLHHPHLVTADVSSFCYFFQKHFNAEIVYDDLIDGDRNIFLRIGKGRMHLFQSRNPPPRGRNVFHHIGIMVTGLADFVRKLDEAGVTVSPVTVTPGGGFAMAEGPDGLKIELFEVSDEERRIRFFVD